LTTLDGGLICSAHALLLIFSDSDWQDTLRFSGGRDEDRLTEGDPVV